MDKKYLESWLFILIIIWAVFLLNFLLWGVELRDFGIRPRSLYGLVGIITSPFLHGGWGHIIRNSIALAILLPVLYHFYKDVKYEVVIFSVLIGGAAVWLLGRADTNHIGASGLVFSLLGFLIAAGLFKMSAKSFIIAIVVLLLYGGTMIRGFIPREGISWESHLFGAIAGVFIAWLYRKSLKEKNE